MKKTEKNKNKLVQQLITGILVFVLLMVLLSDTGKKTEMISISELAEKIKKTEIKDIKIELGDLKITTKKGKKLNAKKELESSLSESLINFGVKPEELKNIKIEVGNPTSFSYYFAKWFPFILPIVFVLLIL